jgi:Domain of unknown function (DUF4124)
MSRHFIFIKSHFYILSAFLGIIFAALMLPLHAHAEIYKTVDAEGRVTYSNVKIKGSKKLDLEPADTSFGTGASSGGSGTKRVPATRTATPASFPKVDAGTQNQRDGKRKDILQNELDAEKLALDDAKKAYAEGASNPEVFKTQNGQTRRNVPKFEEKMKTLQADVDAHQRNIELLQKEINAI